MIQEDNENMRRKDKWRRERKKGDEDKKEQKTMRGVKRLEG